MGQQPQRRPMSSSPRCESLHWQNFKVQISLNFQFQSIYRSMGANRLDSLYPLTTLDLSTVETMSSRLNEAAYNCSVVLSVLGHTKAPERSLGDNEYRIAICSCLPFRGASEPYSSLVGDDVTSRGRREHVYLDERLWEENGSATNPVDTLKAYEQSKQVCQDARYPSTE